MIFAFYGHLDYLHLEINVIGKHVSRSQVTDEKPNWHDCNSRELPPATAAQQLSSCFVTPTPSTPPPRRNLFPCGDSMVCIIDDREDVWKFAPNLITVKKYIYFQGTGDINAPPGSREAQTERKGTERKERSTVGQFMQRWGVEGRTHCGGGISLLRPVLFPWQDF